MVTPDWLKLQNIFKAENENIILTDFNWDMGSETQAAIMGETGSGKSSLLKMIAGLVQPDEGSIFFEGNRVSGPLETLIPGHPGIAYLSQFFELRPNFYVYEIFEYANTLSHKDADDIYSICQITHLMKRKTTQLSGGERQRIALARLLTTKPKLLLLDEPFSHLDLPHRTTIKRVIQDAKNAFNLRLILVSHDPADILPWAESVTILKDGKIVTKGSPIELYKNPSSEYVSDLMGFSNFFDKKAASEIASYPFNKTGSYMIRPENLIISHFESSGPQATIKQIQFIGHGYNIHLELNTHSVKVFSNSNSWQSGQTVRLSAHSEHFILIPTNE